MPFVHSLGARAYLQPGDSDPPVFGFQLFATLATGNIVMAVEANGLQAERIPESVDELEEMILTGLRAPERDVRTSIFGNLVDELARQDIRTDLETLMHLPFRLEVTDEVRALVEP